MSDISQITLGGVTYDIKDEVARTQIQVLDANKASNSSVSILSGRVDDVEDDVQSLIAAVGTPLVAATAAAMTDHSKIYVYTGSEAGYTAGNWYYWNGSDWTSGGVYNSTAFNTDTTLTVLGAAADAKATGNLLFSLETAEDFIKYGNNGYMNSSASFPAVSRNRNLLTLNGQYGSDSASMYSIKLTGNLNKTAAPSTAAGWNKELSLNSGRTYSVRMDLISGTVTNANNVVFEVRVLNESSNVVETISLNEEKEFAWAGGNALIYLAAGININCSNAVLSIFVKDASKDANIKDDISKVNGFDTNLTLDYLASNAFSVYSADYLTGKGYSGTTGNIIDSTHNIITGYIPVEAGDYIKSFVNGVNWIKNRVDGQTRKIVFYNTSKAWERTISTSNGLGVDCYPVQSDGFVRFMLRDTDLNPQVFITSLLKKNKLVDLIVFAGQSNMAGRGETNGVFPESYPAIIPGAGYEFKSITDPTKLYPLTEPFGYAENAADDTSGIYDGTKKTGDMVAAFVNAYYTNNGNVPVVGVSASEGGSSSVEWQPTTGNNFVDLSNRLTTARQWLVDNGYSIRHQYCAWCQGESDGDNIASGTEILEEYKTRARAIFSGLIALGLEKVLLIRIGNHNNESGTSTRYSAIIQWQTEEAQTNDALVMVSCDFAGMRAKNMMKDAFHYYQIGYNITGTSAGTNAALYATTGKEPTMYDPENNNLYYSHKN